MRLASLGLLAGGLFILGCGQPPAPGGANPPQAGSGPGGGTAVAKTSTAPLASGGDSQAGSPSGVTPAGDHGHKPGSHGGLLVSLGRDSYHLEAVVEQGGTLRLYTLGNDESRVIDIEQQTLKAFVKSGGDTTAEAITLEPVPQDGDPAGRTSQFVGQLPAGRGGGEWDITIPNIVIAGERFRASFRSGRHAEEEMPAKVADEEERELYLTPGGLYTAADIEANGNTTASLKFRGIKSSHNLTTKSGDRVCPVTKTKANPKFSWIIDGRSYEFCCPPCVDEFVRRAKENPAEVLAPEKYIKE